MHARSHALRTSLPFACALLIPALAITAALRGGMWSLAVPGFIFVVTPLLELLLGNDTAQLTDEKAAHAWRDWRFDVWLWAWIPLELAAVVLALDAVASGRTDDVPSFVALVASIGLCTGAGINVGHELMHRKGAVERALAEVLLTTTSYTHFCVEHVLGHHKHVATPADPASSRLGEHVYAYLPRTVLGGLRSAWKLESARAHRSGSAGSLRDRRVRYPLVLLAVYIVVAATFGPLALLAFMLQGVVAFTLLEVINFIEHYGLSRSEMAPGVYERCLPAHSWNSPARFTNWLLFHLQRHADHHHIASRPYFALRHIDDSPQLPAGYATLVLCALVPPLWRRVMDPRVHRWHARAGGAATTDAAHEAAPGVFSTTTA